MFHERHERRRLRAKAASRALFAGGSCHLIVTPVSFEAGGAELILMRLVPTLLTTVFLAVVLAFIAPSSALAINECGKADAARNITSNGVSCSTARSFARAFGVDPGCQEDTRCKLRGFSCRNKLVSRSASRGTVDFRCTRGSKVIRFQWSIGL